MNKGKILYLGSKNTSKVIKKYDMSGKWWRIEIRLPSPTRQHRAGGGCGSASDTCQRQRDAPLG